MGNELPAWLEKEYPFERHTLKTAEGHRLNYVDEGHGECIFMFHGNPTWSFYYRQLIFQLRENFRCIALDNIGCGLSDKPQHYSYCLNNHIANASALMEKIQPTAFHIIVHDWGCPIGMAMAELYADRTQRIIITNGAAFLSKHIPWRIALAKTTFPGTLFVKGLNLFAKAATRLCVQNHLTETLCQAYLFPYNSWANRIAVDAFIKDIPMSKHHKSWQTLQMIEAQLPSLQKKKILIAWGMKDFCFTEKFLQQWQKIFSDARIIPFANAGHYLLEDASDELIEKIRKFLTEEH
ncbi:MAG: alpha/beta fold hydrolase [Puniceicoccales bacterium]|jgi:haloalkane dehalogenase|nr:alpha/beta fold hydrolase [Puniceicoccales bacterium]